MSSATIRPETIEISEMSWKLIDVFFRDNPSCLVDHHLESYNDFVHNGIPRIFKENNPIRFIEREDESRADNSRNECLLYLGGKDGKDIYYGKPVIYDDRKKHYMYPNEARLRNMTYGFTIHYDVHVEYIYSGGGGGAAAPEIKTTKLEKILLGKFPIMMQSDLCILRGLPREIRFNMGECRNDPGGYFIIDGKEKIIIPQEEFGNNMLYIRSYKPDDVYTHSVEIRSVSEDTSKPIRTLAVKIVAPSPNYTNGQIVVAVPNVKKPVPLFILMRALGVISDRDIIKTCLLDMNQQEHLIDLFIPSVHDAGWTFTQQNALEFMAELTKRGTIITVMEILTDFFLPHVGEMNFINKAFFLGHMVYRMLKVSTGEKRPTDRDNFKYKRVELTGSLMYDLFREYYLLQKKDIARKIDEEYYYHKGAYVDDSAGAAGAPGTDGDTKKGNKKHRSRAAADSSSAATGADNMYRNNFTSLIESNFKTFFKDRIVEQGFRKGFKGNWGADARTKRLGAVQDLNRLSWYTFISHLRKINLPLDASAKVVGPRLLNSSQWGYIDPIDTPDGGNIGLHKHMAISAYVTSGSPAGELIQWLLSSPPPHPDLVVKSIHECNTEELAVYTKLFVNGSWIGAIEHPSELIDILKLYRRNGILPIYTSISFDIENNEVNLYTDAGRLTRPIYYTLSAAAANGADAGKRKHNKKLSYDRRVIQDGLKTGEITWSQITAGFLPKPAAFAPKKNKLYRPETLYDGDATIAKLRENQSMVDYVDTAEEENALIAVNYDVYPTKPYTHMEIDRTFILGVMGNLVVYPENNPIARNVFSCGQSKQAVSVYHSNYQMRIDKMGVVLNNGQIPLIKSRYLKYINNEEQPYGANVIVGIMCYTGYNVEDAILINRASIDRGLFRTSYYSMYEAREESSKINGAMNSRFANIEKNNVIGKRKGYDYSFLDDHGLVREGTELNDKIILIGKINSDVTNKDVWIDDSVKTKKGQLGFVDKAFITLGEEGFNVAKVRLREDRVPAIGDKMASRVGQKGTIGLVIPEEDMPFTADGVRFDMIVNPHAIPSRMTIGMLIEQMFGKACLHYGGFGDCTAFQVQGSNYSTYGPMLTRAGFNHTGNELTYNGTTGEQIEADVFVGPVYYMRLKHMVKDKINYRARGPNAFLTRQPIGGRANDGGLRIGEMERDGVAGHGLSHFLEESMMVRADEYYMAVCNKTGAIAIYNEAKNIFLSPFVDGPVKFHTTPEGVLNVKNISRHGRSFSLVRVPYAFKLLIQELQIMGVQMRIITEENIDQLTNMSYSHNITTLLGKPAATSKEELEKVVKEYVKDMHTLAYAETGTQREFIPDAEMPKSPPGPPPGAAAARQTTQLPLPQPKSPPGPPPAHLRPQPQPKSPPGPPPLPPGAKFELKPAVEAAAVATAAQENSGEASPDFAPSMWGGSRSPLAIAAAASAVDETVEKPAGKIDENTKVIVVKKE